MNSTPDGKVALVAGATVMCTGRSSAAGKAGSDYDRPEPSKRLPTS